MPKSPYIIGIAGPSCSGKHTVANYLKRQLGDAVVLSTHNYYFDTANRSAQAREHINYDHPNSIDVDLLKKHLSELSERKPIKKPIYNFRNQTRDGFEVITPRTIVILEGLHVFLWNDIRASCSYRIFTYANHNTCLYRRINRDIEERRRDRKAILTRYQRDVRPMCDHFILPTQSFADIVVELEDLANIENNATMKQLVRNVA